MATFVTSDIHGCRKTFNKLLEEIKLTTKDELIIIGDIIDRGPDTRGLITDLLQLKENAYKLTVLRGNHEDFMLTAYRDKGVFDCWAYPQNGGDKTLYQYGWTGPQKDPYGYTYYDRDYIRLFPKEHFRFIAETKHVYEKDNFVFVHAGLDFHAKDPIKDTPDYNKLWNRSFRYNEEKLGGRYLITGHTPQTRKDIVQNKDFGFKHLILDNGCCFDGQGYGNLCCLVLDTMEFIFVRNCENKDRIVGVDKERWME